MAVTTVQVNNKLIQFTKEINREYVRDNLFSPYMGEDITSIIRRHHEPKKGGEVINIPLVGRLRKAGVSHGTLVGNEEAIDNYGMRVYVDWNRHAVATNEAEGQKDSADIFGEAKPLLSDWGKEEQRDEIIEAMMALPTESVPTNLGTAAGQRVNGILYEAATGAQRTTWHAQNYDRVVYGNLLSNYVTTASTGHADSLALLDGTGDMFKMASVTLMKRLAKIADPHIRPWKTSDGREYYVAFAGTNNFAQLKLDMNTGTSSPNLFARPRETMGPNGAPNNPVFQDGDLLYDGVIIREIPEIDSYVNDRWTTLKTAGTTGTRTAPVFMCGQQAVAMAWAKMATPTVRDETDYQFIKGVGIKMAYGVAKMFRKYTRMRCGHRPADCGSSGRRDGQFDTGRHGNWASSPA